MRHRNFDPRNTITQLSGHENFNHTPPPKYEEIVRDGAIVSDEPPGL
jgi:hypothetical protein